MNSEDLTEVGRRIGDISDLPEELRKQLSTSKLDEIEEQILGTMKNRYDGVASLDEIMVGLYRDYGYIVKERRSLNGKLYRMKNKDVIESVPKKKGVYRIR